MHATIEYQNGLIVNYLLTAYSPAEGYRVVFHGTRGRVALETVERAYVRPDGGLVYPPLREHSSIVVQPAVQPSFRAHPAEDGRAA